MTTSKQITNFIENSLQDDLSQDGPNLLELCDIHYDYESHANIISVKTITGEHYTIMVNRGFIG